MSQRETGASGIDSPGCGRAPDAATITATRDQPARRVFLRHALLAAIVAIAVVGLATLR